MKAYHALLGLLFAGFLFSCQPYSHSNEDHHHHDEDHSHEVVPLMLTRYSESFELFAEAEPLVVDQTSEVLAHFTHLANFKPFDGEITSINLTQDDHATVAKAIKKVKPGIFRFQLTPKHAGKHEVEFIMKDQAVDYSFRLDLIVSSTKPEAEEIAESSQVSISDAQFFSKEQSWKIDFATDYPKLSQQGPQIKATAKLSPLPSKVATIHAGISGIISDPDNKLFPGRKVEKGEALAWLKGNLLADESIQLRMAQARKQWEKAEQDFLRVKSLREEKIVSEREFLDAQLAYHLAENEWLNLERSFQPDGQVLLATESGRLHRVYVESGEYAEAGQALFAIDPGSHLLLEAQIAPRYRKNLSRIASIELKTSDGAYFLSESLDWNVLSIGSSTQADNFQLPVLIAVRSHPDLFAGTFVELMIRTQGETEHLIVPQTALVEQQGNYFVYVQHHPESFEKRFVQVEALFGQDAIIRSGLQPNERMVTRGAILLKLAEASGGLDAHAGHVH